MILSSIVPWSFPSSKLASRILIPQGCHMLSRSCSEPSCQVSLFSSYAADSGLDASRAGVFVGIRAPYNAISYRRKRVFGISSRVDAWSFRAPLPDPDVRVFTRSSDVLSGLRFARGARHLVTEREETFELASREPPSERASERAERQLVGDVAPTAAVGFVSWRW